MAKAVTCPVCFGTGTIDEDYPGAGKSNERICHGCEGKGWVAVADDPMPYYPYPTYIPPICPNPSPYTEDPIPNATWRFVNV